jgi:hypothetical protein
VAVHCADDFELVQEAGNPRRFHTREHFSSGYGRGRPYIYIDVCRCVKESLLSKSSMYAASVTASVC